MCSLTAQNSCVWLGYTASILEQAGSPCNDISKLRSLFTMPQDWMDVAHARECLRELLRAVKRMLPYARLTRAFPTETAAAASPTCRTTTCG